MKTRSLLIAALVIVLLVAYYVVGTDYLKKRQENKDLNSQVADITFLLAQTAPPSVHDVENRLAAAREELNIAKSAFPQYTNTTMIINYILKIAQDIGVKAMPLLTQDWANETVNGFSYRVFRLHINITADSARFSAFQERLENGDIATLVIENLIVERRSSIPWGSSVGGGAPGVSASMDVAVYSRLAE